MDIINITNFLNWDNHNSWFTRFNIITILITYNYIKVILIDTKNIENELLIFKNMS